MPALYHGVSAEAGEEGGEDGEEAAEERSDEALMPSCRLSGSSIFCIFFPSRRGKGRFVL